MCVDETTGERGCDRRHRLSPRVLYYIDANRERRIREVLTFGIYVDDVFCGSR